MLIGEVVVTMPALRKATLLSWPFAALFLVGAAIAPAHAQATRTWVSGVGDDGNPCSRTAPCMTWAGTIAKTAAGGEIDNLDQGGFGAVTITKSITLDGGGGNIAGTLASGTAGITVVAGTSDVVILRNLQFDGINGNGTGTAGTPGTIGINLLEASRVIIENCRIFGFAQAGIAVAPATGTMNAKLLNTTININASGVLVSPTGGSTANVAIDGTRIDNNMGGGLKVTGVSGTTENVAINDSTISLNAGNGINAVSNNSIANVDLERVTLSGNGAAGVQSNQTGGSATVTVGSSMLSHNGSAWSIVSGGTIASFGNNQVTGTQGSTPTSAAVE
jgi:hypothetical protein